MFEITDCDMRKQIRVVCLVLETLMCLRFPTFLVYNHVCGMNLYITTTTGIADHKNPYATYIMHLYIISSMNGAVFFFRVVMKMTFSAVIGSVRGCVSLI